MQSVSSMSDNGVDGLATLLEEDPGSPLGPLRQSSALSSSRAPPQSHHPPPSASQVLSSRVTSHLTPSGSMLRGTADGYHKIQSQSGANGAIVATSRALAASSARSMRNQEDAAAMAAAAAEAAAAVGDEFENVANSSSYLLRNMLPQYNNMMGRAANGAQLPGVPSTLQQQQQQQQQNFIAALTRPHPSAYAQPVMNPHHRLLQSMMSPASLAMMQPMASSPIATMMPPRSYGLTGLSLPSTANASHFSHSLGVGSLMDTRHRDEAILSGFRQPYLTGATSSVPVSSTIGGLGPDVGAIPTSMGEYLGARSSGNSSSVLSSLAPSASREMRQRSAQSTPVAAQGSESDSDQEMDERMAEAAAAAAEAVYDRYDDSSDENDPARTPSSRTADEGIVAHLNSAFSPRTRDSLLMLDSSALVDHNGSSAAPARKHRTRANYPATGTSGAGLIEVSDDTDEWSAEQEGQNSPRQDVSGSAEDDAYNSSQDSAQQRLASYSNSQLKTLQSMKVPRTKTSATHTPSRKQLAAVAKFAREGSAAKAGASSNTPPANLTEGTAGDTTKNNRRFVCTFEGCEKAFQGISELDRHKLIHTEERPFACEEPDCAQKFRQKAGLTRHMLTHKGIKPHRCRFGCGKVFTTRSALKVHERQHTGATPFPCDANGCGKRFKTLQALQYHRKHLHQPEDFPDPKAEGNAGEGHADHHKDVANGAAGSSRLSSCTNKKCRKIFLEYASQKEVIEQQMNELRRLREEMKLQGTTGKVKSLQKRKSPTPPGAPNKGKTNGEAVTKSRKTSTDSAQSRKVTSNDNQVSSGTATVTTAVSDSNAVPTIANANGSGERNSKRPRLASSSSPSVKPKQAPTPSRSGVSTHSGKGRTKKGVVTPFASSYSAPQASSKNSAASKASPAKTKTKLTSAASKATAAGSSPVSPHDGKKKASITTSANAESKKKSGIASMASSASQ